MAKKISVKFLSVSAWGWALLPPVTRARAYILARRLPARWVVLAEGGRRLVQAGAPDPRQRTPKGEVMVGRGAWLLRPATGQGSTKHIHFLTQNRHNASKSGEIDQKKDDENPAANPIVDPTALK